MNSCLLLSRQSRNFSSSSHGKKEVVGFIGLGNMGGFMAQNLVKNGHKVVAFDKNENALKKLIDFQPGQAVSAKTPADVAKQAKKIVTMLPSSPHVKEVYEGPDGILGAAQPSSFFIDSSTIDPLVSRQIAENAKKASSSFVDAPVSGGIVGAEKATLTFMVGGTKEEFETAKQLLQLMGKNIVHCGPSGNGQVVKICNNLALAIEMIGISEAMNLGIKLGMDPKVLAGIFNTSSARCWSSDTYNPVPGVMEGVPSSRGYAGGFGVDLMAKDVGLAVSAASQVKASTPLGDVALQLYREISAKGNGNKDFGFVYEFLRNHH
eukprot:TRINITY_DN2567_c0_g1_i1.p1 TRINITY_DN2567_c0_g1~~TRINITY_DN2567_c0_g1_i1.p1  ORF type:complete len:321 (-),score=102.75 TRINITY_DN2567_c0_g1_i1:29-991(-)